MRKEEHSQEENEQKREDEKPIITILLECKVDINLKNKEGYTALTLACKNKNWKLADDLIFCEDQKCNINLTPDVSTPLHFAVEFKDLKTIRSLLTQKVDAKLFDSKKLLPIDYAVLNKDKAVIKLLLEYNHYINFDSQYIEEFLPYLIEFNYFNLFEEIIKKDKKRVNFIFSSPESNIEKCSLIAHSINQKRKEFTSLLLSNDVDVNIEINKTEKNEEGFFYFYKNRC
jgi:ankyrin repeat protein